MLPSAWCRWELERVSYAFTPVASHRLRFRRARYGIFDVPVILLRSSPVLLFSCRSNGVRTRQKERLVLVAAAHACPHVYGGGSSPRILCPLDELTCVFPSQSIYVCFGAGGSRNAAISKRSRRLRRGSWTLFRHLL